MIAGKCRTQQHQSRRVRLLRGHDRRQRAQRMAAHKNLFRIHLRQRPGIFHDRRRIFRLGGSSGFFRQTVAFSAADAVMTKADDAVFFQFLRNGHQRPFVGAARQAVAQHQTGAVFFFRQVRDPAKGLSSDCQRKRRLHSNHLLQQTFEQGYYRPLFSTVSTFLLGDRPLPVAGEGGGVV